MIAPPTMAMMSSEDPVEVNRPSPWMAMPQIAGQIIALVNPSQTNMYTDANPGVKIAARLTAMLAEAENIRAVRWLNSFGMPIMPSR